ncbi:MAG: 16S rRNA (guanine(966)-N(2))-methyltransferase RsmD, partial [Lentisphaeria bacterium]
MVRIISGEARGVTLNVPDGIEVRPTLDKVKGAIFSALGDITDAKVLDLFAGSGNLGLEALSRGASEVLMFEQIPAFCENIRANITKVTKSILAFKNRAESDFSVRVISGDGLQVYKQAGKANHFDLILADPPYVPNSNQKGPIDVLTSEELAKFVTEEAILVLESGPEIFAMLPEKLPWELIRRKSYGATTAVSF